MPLNMAMEKPDTRVTGLEPNDGVTVCIDHENVAASGRSGYVNSVECILFFRSSSGTLRDDLGNVSVDVVRMGATVKVVDYDLDDPSDGCVQDDGIAVFAVDGWVGNIL